MRKKRMVILSLTLLSMLLTACSFTLDEQQAIDHVEVSRLVSPPEALIGSWIGTRAGVEQLYRFEPNGTWYWVFPTGEQIGGEYWFEDETFYITDYADVMEQVGAYELTVEEGQGEVHLSFRLLEDPVHMRAMTLNKGLTRTER